MNYTELVVGDRVLVQSAAEIREHAVIKGINRENEWAIVRLTNNAIIEIHPQFIIKSFGQR